MSEIERHEATVLSSSQQMKSQQNMMIFNHSVTEDLARELNQTQSNMNLNDDKDSEQNSKKHYTK